MQPYDYLNVAITGVERWAVEVL